MINFLVTKKIEFILSFFMLISSTRLFLDWF